MRVLREDVNKKIVEDIFDGDSSKAEIKSSIVNGAEAAGQDVNDDALDNEVEKIWAATDLIKNVEGATNDSELKQALQRSLNTAIRNKAAKIDSDYPNILVCGLAGFGKTAIVESFCREHHLNIFECDAKNLDAATVGGIPYPTKDPKTGELYQSPIGSRYWNKLNSPNCVLFLDELNRAAGGIRGTLLTLVNNHKLPASIEDKNGNVREYKKYDNILFTVIAINPADDIFPDNSPLDPAEVSRNGGIIMQNGSNIELLNHLNRWYDDTLSDKNLDDGTRAELAGQKDIANAILSNVDLFKFDDEKKVRDIYYAQGSDMRNFLNYRTFTIALLNCDGTKEDFLKAVKVARFCDDDQQMIANCLKNFTDKQTRANRVWTDTQNVKTTQKVNTAKSKDALDAFKNNLSI